jgi:hypothetical protein
MIPANGGENKADDRESFGAGKKNGGERTLSPPEKLQAALVT